MDLHTAIKLLLEKYFLEDFIYEIRDSAHDKEPWEGSRWDHPRVVEFTEICKVLTAYKDSNA